MEAKKFYWIPKKTRKHSDIFPESFRSLIIGQSGSGKTALLMKMLLQDNLLDDNNLLIFGRSLHQPEYQLLKHGFQNGLGKANILEILNYDTKINELNEKTEHVAVGFSQE